MNAIAQLLDSRGGQEKVIFAKPEDFEEMGLFTKQILKERVELLAGNGVSSYKLYVIFKPINFLMPRADWENFAKDIYNKSTLAKSNDKNLIMVVPYVYSVCTGSEWYGSVSVGTGMVMPAVYCKDSEIALRNSMNSALALTGVTWEQNFDQAFSQIPKKHYLMKYAVSYDFLTKRYNTVTTDGPDHSNIYELQIIVDSRLQTNIDAATQVNRQMKSTQINPTVLATNEAILRDLPGLENNPYLLRHGLKEKALAEMQGEVSIHADQFVKWFVHGKAAEFERSSAAWASNVLDQTTNSPADTKFITGVNPVRLDNILAAMDAVGMVLNFVELDWITDGAGFIVASYYRDEQNKIIYGASLALPVSAYMIKVVAKRIKVLKKQMNGQWELVEETTFLAKNADELAAGLTGDLRKTYDELMAGGLKSGVSVDNTIIFTSASGDEIAEIVENKLVVKKWGFYKDSYTKIETSEGYWLVKDGDDVIGIDLGFKENRILKAEEVNAYWKNGRLGYEPYKPGTLVTERRMMPGEKIYIVEYAGQSIPGAFGSRDKILTVQELRDKLAVIKPWKDEDAGFLVVREYEAKNGFRVRDGLIGPQIEEVGTYKGQTFAGGGHQYEFLEGKWDAVNSYEDFMVFKDTFPLK